MLPHILLLCSLCALFMLSKKKCSFNFEIERFFFVIFVSHCVAVLNKKPLTSEKSNNKVLQMWNKRIWNKFIKHCEQREILFDDFNVLI